MLAKLRAALSSDPDYRQRLAGKLLAEMDEEGVPRLSPRRLRVEWAGSNDGVWYSRFAERRTRELLTEREELAPKALALAPPSFTRIRAAVYPEALTKRWATSLLQEMERKGISHTSLEWRLAEYALRRG